MASVGDGVASPRAANVSLRASLHGLVRGLDPSRMEDAVGAHPWMGEYLGSEPPVAVGSVDFRVENVLLSDRLALMRLDLRRETVALLDAVDGVVIAKRGVDGPVQLDDAMGKTRLLLAMQEMSVPQMRRAARAACASAAAGDGWGRVHAAALVGAALGVAE